MGRGCIVVTGVARHSLGEAFVRALLGRATGHQVIGIDRVANADLDNVAGLQQVLFDLNPLGGSADLTTFATALENTIGDVVTTAGSRGVEDLVQCAGLYDFGTFLDHDVERRKALLGLNVVGTTELLHAVMRLNHRLRRQNHTEFTHMLVGSFQGLYARKRRPIYAPSKAYGIDLCTSLVEGREVAKCLYLAAGPLDTPMLHRNHWVKKAKGSEEFFQRILDGPRERYRSIFVHCDQATLENAAHDEFRADVEALRIAMRKYRAQRKEACAAELGVLSAECCGSVLASILVSAQSQSGVYMVRAGAEGTGVLVTMATFKSLDRGRVFKSAAKGVAL
jgi:short-subunit dehydrogenase